MTTAGVTEFQNGEQAPWAGGLQGSIIGNWKKYKGGTKVWIPDWAEVP